MNTLIAGFTKQLSEAYQIGERAMLSAFPGKLSNVLVTGLGGSGIGGTIVSDLVAGEAALPVLVNKDYFLPDFVSSSSLVIVSSYSGNTEETLQAMEAALKKNAKVVCISSGGRVIELAKKNNLDHIIIPGGMPPRACLAYSFTQLFFILNFFGIISGNFKSALKKATDHLDKEEENIRKEAKSIAQKLNGKIPVIYCAAGTEGVAVRLRQQINENAKMLCWHHVLPEMNHNELVGWREKNENLAILIFRNKSDYSRTQTRIEISKEIFLKYTASVSEVWSKGDSNIEKALYFIHLGDWISFYLAELKQTDAIEVKVIDHLKNELSKI